MERTSPPTATATTAPTASTAHCRRSAAPGAAARPLLRQASMLAAGHSVVPGARVARGPPQWGAAGCQEPAAILTGCSGSSCCSPSPPATLGDLADDPHAAGLHACAGRAPLLHGDRLGCSSCRTVPGSPTTGSSSSANIGMFVPVGRMIAALWLPRRWWLLGAVVAVRPVGRDRARAGPLPAVPGRGSAERAVERSRRAARCHPRRARPSLLPVPRRQRLRAALAMNSGSLVRLPSNGRGQRAPMHQA